MPKSHASAWASDAPTPAQIKEFFAQIESGKITKEKMQSILRGAPDYTGSFVFLSEWHEFFHRVFGRDVDFSNIHIPPKPDYFCRAIVNPNVFTPNEIYEACVKNFGCWRYTGDLNAVKDVVSRPNGPYVIWVKDVQEADPEMANISANQIAARKINTETLTERLLHELKYFKETSNHLDEKNVTLCAASQYPDGCVPRVGWYPSNGRMCVDWYYSGYRCGSIRARVAVS